MLNLRTANEEEHQRVLREDLGYGMLEDEEYQP
jgi:hypothetical protein